MSVSRLFTVIGDANVRRNMTGLNVASREAMKSAQVLACDTLASLDSVMNEVRAESSVCIVAAITEMLLTADNTGTVASSIESVLHSFKSRLITMCNARPSLTVLVAPPLFRQRPFWYQKNLPQISGLFSSILSNDHPGNFGLLPSFCSQDLLPDGIYLTPVSGLHYVLHLFDQTEAAAMLQTLGSEAQFYNVKERSRQHEDRIVFLEQRHELLDCRMDVKIAADAEFNDWVVNRSEEDWLTVLGSKRLPSVDNTGEWQKVAKRQMNEIFKLVLSATKTRLDYSVVYVTNPLRYKKQGQTVYNVRLNSVEAARRLKDLFSGFFRRDRPDQLPSSLKGVSLRNKITLETRVRISILHQLGINFQESNGAGSSYKVKGYDSRPLLTTFPPSGSKDSRPRTFTFIEAVSQLPGVLSDEGLVSIHQIIGQRHQGQLQALFVVLRDDDRLRIEEMIRNKLRGNQSRVGPAMTSSGQVSNLGSGMDVQAVNFSTVNALRLPPPPPPAQPPPSSKPPSSETDQPRKSSMRSERRSRSPTPSLAKSSTGLKRHRLSSSSDESRHVDRHRPSKSSRRRSASSSSESEPRRRSSRSRGRPKKSKSKSKSKKKKSSRRRSSSSSSSSTSSGPSTASEPIRER